MKISLLFALFSTVSCLSLQAMHSDYWLPELGAEIDTLIRRIDDKTIDESKLPAKIYALQEAAKNFGNYYNRACNYDAEKLCRNIVYNLSDVRIYVMKYTNIRSGRGHTMQQIRHCLDKSSEYVATLETREAA